jgi:hypothetical protein
VPVSHVAITSSRPRRFPDQILAPPGWKAKIRPAYSSIDLDMARRYELGSPQVGRTTHRPLRIDHEFHRRSGPGHISIFSESRSCMDLPKANDRGCVLDERKKTSPRETRSAAPPETSPATS